MSYHQCEACGSGHVCNTEECPHVCPVPCETPMDETDILKRTKRERDNANFQWSYMVQEISKAVGVPCVTPASAVDLVRNLAVCVEVSNRELRETRDAILAEGMEYREDDGPAPYWRNRRALEAEQKMREYQKKIKELELKVRTLRMLKAERELAETRLEWARSVDAAAATRKALQADLDAALNWIEHDEDESIPPAGLWQRVKALLEKRRVERG